jgi:hypothetical protein
MKNSSAYIAPETLAVVVEEDQDQNKQQQRVVIKNSIVNFKHKVDPVIADPSFDVW